jgi:hypothetical protein
VFSFGFLSARPFLVLNKSGRCIFQHRAWSKMGECFICLESEPAPIYTGCACRGNAGLAHVACLVANALAQRGCRGCRGCRAAHGQRAWSTCPTCTQEFTGKMARGLADACCDYAGLGEEHQIGAAFLRSSAFIDEGANADAESALRALHARLRQTLGDENIATLVAAHNLASAIMGQGRYEEAERILREVLRAQTTGGSGAGRAPALSAEAHLAVVISRRGLRDEAVRTLRAVGAAQKVLIGATHLDTMVSEVYLAWVLCEDEAYAEAERVCLAVLPGLQRLLGDMHPLTMSCARSMGLALVRMGRHTDAQVIFEGVLDTLMQTEGPDHRETIVWAKIVTDGRRRVAAIRALGALGPRGASGPGATPRRTIWPSCARAAALLTTARARAARRTRRRTSARAVARAFRLRGPNGARTMVPDGARSQRAERIQEPGSQSPRSASIAALTRTIAPSFFFGSCVYRKVEFEGSSLI